MTIQINYHGRPLLGRFICQIGSALKVELPQGKRMIHKDWVTDWDADERLLRPTRQRNQTWAALFDRQKMTF